MGGRGGFLWSSEGNGERGDEGDGGDGRQEWVCMGGMKSISMWFTFCILYSLFYNLCFELYIEYVLHVVFYVLCFT